MPWHGVINTYGIVIQQTAYKSRDLLNFLIPYICYLIIHATLFTVMPIPILIQFQEQLPNGQQRKGRR